MDECRGIKGVSGTFVRQLAVGHLTKLVINERDELFHDLAFILLRRRVQQLRSGGRAGARIRHGILLPLFQATCAGIRKTKNHST